MKKGIRIAAIVYLAFLVVFLCLLLIPPLFGYNVHSAVGDSMYPTLKSGSLVITAPVEAADIELGDIIAFKDGNEALLIHRVISIDITESIYVFKTKGDANEGIDGSVGEDNIIGRYYISIPLLGRLIQFIRMPVGLAFVFIVTAVMIIIMIINMS